MSSWPLAGGNGPEHDPGTPRSAACKQTQSIPCATPGPGGTHEDSPGVSTPGSTPTSNCVPEGRLKSHSRPLRRHGNPSPCREIRSWKGNPGAVPTIRGCACFSAMWKNRPELRTKPVIVRDTTCSVSLLTGTICGSNFAIPSNNIPPHGNGTELRSSMENAVRCPARGDSALSAGKKRLRRPGFQIQSPAPETFSKSVQQRRKPIAGSRVKCGGRFPDPPPGYDNKLDRSKECGATFVTCLPGRQGAFLSPGRQQDRGARTWKA